MYSYMRIHGVSISHYMVSPMSSNSTPASSKEATSVYMKLRDKRLVEAMSNLEHRGISDQLTVIINEACERRGLDPEALAAQVAA